MSLTKIKRHMVGEEVGAQTEEGQGVTPLREGEHGTTTPQDTVNSKEEGASETGLERAPEEASEEMIEEDEESMAEEMEGEEAEKAP